jgi:1-deoxy-D-xylulose 5-phosphate reductoisomerase
MRRWLFDVPVEKIDVNIHPQSIIHSMVEYIDGCVIAQLGTPDMKAPIAYALSYPERVSSGVKPLDLTSMSALTFFRPDMDKFRCLGLAYHAINAGESMPAVMNAANEIAVEAFLEGAHRFHQIAETIERTMNAHSARDLCSIEEVLEADQWGRETSRKMPGDGALMMVIYAIIVLGTLIFVHELGHSCWPNCWGRRENSSLGLAQADKQENRRDRISALGFSAGRLCQDVR